MNFKEIKQLQQMMKTVKQLKELKMILKGLKGLQREEKKKAWLMEHKKLFQNFSDQELETVREQADYDQEAWQEILKELKE